MHERVGAVCDAVCVGLGGGGHGGEVSGGEERRGEEERRGRARQNRLHSVAPRGHKKLREERRCVRQFFVWGHSRSQAERTGTSDGNDAKPAPSLCCRAAACTLLYSSFHNTIIITSSPFHTLNARAAMRVLALATLRAYCFAKHLPCA